MKKLIIGLSLMSFCASLPMSHDKLVAQVYDLDPNASNTEYDTFVEHMQTSNLSVQDLVHKVLDREKKLMHSHLQTAWGFASEDWQQIEKKVNTPDSFFKSILINHNPLSYLITLGIALGLYVYKNYIYKHYLNRNYQPIDSHKEQAIKNYLSKSLDRPFLIVPGSPAIKEYPFFNYWYTVLFWDNSASMKDTEAKSIMAHEIQHVLCKTKSYNSHIFQSLLCKKVRELGLMQGLSWTLGQITDLCSVFNIYKRYDEFQADMLSFLNLNNHKINDHFLARYDTNSDVSEQLQNSISPTDPQLFGNHPPEYLRLAWWKRINKLIQAENRLAKLF